jgi:hypothetical protein
MHQPPCVIGVPCGLFDEAIRPFERSVVVRRINALPDIVSSGSAIRAVPVDQTGFRD